MSVEKKRMKIKNSSKKILMEYPNLKGLNNVFEYIWNLSNNKNFKVLIKSTGKFKKKFADSNYYILWASDKFIEEIPQIGYSKEVLFPSKFYYILPRKIKGAIGVDDYASLNQIVFTILDFNNEETSLSNVFVLSHKIMMLLYNFDRNTYFENPNKEYFMKLKDIKWNKNAKKLFKKIDKIKSAFQRTCSEEIFDENPDDGYPFSSGFDADVWRCWIFLAGCSAVNNNRDTIIAEDVVCACRTYFKLLATLGND